MPPDDDDEDHHLMTRGAADAMMMLLITPRPPSSFRTTHPAHAPRPPRTRRPLRPSHPTPRRGSPDNEYSAEPAETIEIDENLARDLASLFCDDADDH